MRESLNLRQSQADIRFFNFNRATHLDEGLFMYFYPFCMINLPICTAIILRKAGLPIMLFGSCLVAEYVYFIFSFAGEQWSYHKRAISTSLPYAQLLRDSYINRFANCERSNYYKEINRREEVKYQ